MYRDKQADNAFLYHSTFFSLLEADDLFAWLWLNVVWRQESIRARPLPRLNTWFADSGVRYSYFGLSHLGSG